MALDSKFIILGIYLVPSLGDRSHFTSLSFAYNSELLLGQTDRLASIPLGYLVADSNSLEKLSSGLISLLNVENRVSLELKETSAVRLNQDTIIHGLEYQKNSAVTSFFDKINSFVSEFDNNVEIDTSFFDDQQISDGMIDFFKKRKGEFSRLMNRAFLAVSTNRLNLVPKDLETIVFDEIKLASVGNFLSCRKVYESVRLMG